jgi:hypothetical protein
MTQPHPFRRALEAEDVEAMVATLSADVVFAARRSSGPSSDAPR